MRDRLAAALRPVRRAVLARRRLLAAALTAVTVAAGLHAVAAPAPARVVVPVAARDLPAGTVLTAEDLAAAEFAPGTEPAGLTTDAAGRTLAAPLRAGEPVTDVRLVGPALADGYPGLSAVPVRLPDAAVAGLLRVGDRIDLVSVDPGGTDPPGGGVRVVATDVPVLAIPDAAPDSTASGLTGRLVVVGAPPAQVAAIADASVRTFVTIAFAG